MSVVGEDVAGSASRVSRPATGATVIGTKGSTGLGAGGVTISSVSGVVSGVLCSQSSALPQGFGVLHVELHQTVSPALALLPLLPLLPLLADFPDLGAGHSGVGHSGTTPSVLVVLLL